MAVITALTTLLVISCGGGGGDGDSPAARALTPVSYTGNTSPAAITLANTPILVTNVLFGGSSSEDIPIAVVITETDTSAGERPIGTDHLMDLLHSSMDNIFGDASHGYQLPVAEVINETEYCVSGYVTVKGTLDDFDDTGTVTFDFYNCLMDGLTYDGIVHAHVHVNDFYNFNMMMEIVLMTVTTPELNVSMSGTILVDDSLSGNTLIEQRTMNYVEKVNTSDRMYKFENFVMTAVTDDYFSYYSGGSISYTGEPVALLYDSNYGYLTVETKEPLRFSSTTRLYPDEGGRLVFTGNLSAIQLTVESGRHVKLDLDIDVVAGYEVVRYVLWSELDNVATLDLTDSDLDAMHDSWEISFGLDPNIDDAADNLDNDGLTNLEEYEQGYDPGNPFSPTP